MRTATALAAAGGTDPGLQREVNEDRFLADESRGLFIVIDGVGGQAAGGKAADVALAMVRERLARETGDVRDRVREAITIANNEIYRLASTRPAWDGMACVLTVAVVRDGSVTIGHVGDTRLYKVRGGGLEKITRDHSPVGEREDAQALSEFAAMRHPRRNEVYRDVGSEPHDTADPDFIDVLEIPFEPDAALLLCSDGLTDLVDSASIARTIADFAGDPPVVVEALLAAANAAGGRDNVTAVYVEGERFAAAARRGGRASPPAGDAAMTRRTHGEPAWPRWRRRAVRGAIAALLLAVGGYGLSRSDGFSRLLSLDVPRLFGSTAAGSGPVVVGPTGSIAAAIEAAAPGSEILVEPGEYRERIELRDGIRVVSVVPRGAVIRLPATDPAAAPQPAVTAAGLTRAEFVGFTIVGDARTPLAVGIHVADGRVSLTDIEVTGATDAAIVFAGDSDARLVGSEVHGNPGAAVAVRAGARPQLTQNVFHRNGLSQHAAGTFVIEPGAAPQFRRNLFLGTRPDAFALDAARRELLEAENWFLPPMHRAPAGAPAGRGRQP